MINILSSKFTWGKTILLLKQDGVGRSTGENDSGQILKQIEWYKLVNITLDNFIKYESDSKFCKYCIII